MSLQLEGKAKPPESLSSYATQKLAGCPQMSMWQQELIHP